MGRLYQTIYIDLADKTRIEKERVNTPTATRIANSAHERRLCAAYASATDEELDELAKEILTRIVACTEDTDEYGNLVAGLRLTRDISKKKFLRRRHRTSSASLR